MGLFGAIIGTAIETAKLPLAMTIDAVRLLDPDHDVGSETLKTLDKIEEKANDE